MIVIRSTHSVNRSHLSKVIFCEKGLCAKYQYKKKELKKIENTDAMKKSKIVLMAQNKEECAMLHKTKCFNKKRRSSDQSNNTMVYIVITSLWLIIKSQLV